MTRKILTVSLTIALVAALIGGGTMAWLTAKDNVPAATFTAGNVTIEAGRKVVVRQQPDGSGSDPVAVYGFAANSYEASVSKVDLVSYTEVARYYTAPRGPGDPDIEAWRTNRLAMDAQGNAWVLNTGADAYPGRFNPKTGLQGQLVRIQADTSGLANTHNYTSQSPKSPPPLDFGTDDAVRVFDIGGHDDMPRAIAVDAEGYIWVGFYKGAYLMKYAYNAAAGTLTAVGGPFSPTIGTIRYYDILFAPDGNLFISSRSSTPTVSGSFGIWRFDGTTFHSEQPFNSPYALLIAKDGTVYATSFNRVLRIRDTGGTWTQRTLTDAPTNQTFRGMAFDGLGKIWITSTIGGGGGNRVYWFDLATQAYGYITLTTGNTPVGIERDHVGIMWVVCRTDNQTNNGYLEGFNPYSLAFVAAIQVGPRPYVYRDFIVPGRPWNPGDCDRLDYWVHNTGSKAIRVRATASAEWEFNWEWLEENRDALCFNKKYEGLTFEELQAEVLELDDPVEVTLCEGVQDWVLEEDGYFYYVGDKDPIEYCETVQLCLKVCFVGGKATNEFQGGRYTIVVTFEAAQASNNAPEEVWGVDEVNLWP